jgi:hypothetical protein
MIGIAGCHPRPCRRRLGNTVSAGAKSQQLPNADINCRDCVVRSLAGPETRSTGLRQVQALIAQGLPGTDVATTFMCMHYRGPRCVDDRSRSIRQESMVGAGAYAIPVTVDRVLAGCLLEFLFESQAIPETQLTSLGADNDEISRHRIYGRSRHRAGLVEMVRVGCGRGDHGPSAQ